MGDPSEDPSQNPWVQASNGLTPPPDPDSPEAAGIATDSAPPRTSLGFGRVQHDGVVRTSAGRGKRS